MDINKLKEYFKIYQKFLLTNVEIVTSAESIFQTVLFFQSSRDNDYSAEGINSMIGLLALINDLIIFKYVKNKMITEDPLEKDMISTIPPKPLIPLATLNTSIRHIQLAAEMYAQYKWGEESKWKTITIIESMKALIKLILLVRNKGATLVHKYLPDRSTFLNFLLKKKEEIKRDDMEYIIGGFEENTDLSLPTKKSVIGELLSIFRPLIYIFAILWFRKKGEKKIGWTPWIISLLTEVASLLLSNKSTHTEVIEFNSRVSKLAMYLMRDPMFPIFYGGVGKILGLFEGFSLTSWFSTAIRSFMEYGNKYYFMNAST